MNSLTLRSDSLLGVEFFELKIRISPRKRFFLSETILSCSFGAQIGWINEIKKCAVAVLANFVFSTNF